MTFRTRASSFNVAFVPRSLRFDVLAGVYRGREGVRREGDGCRRTEKRTPLKKNSFENTNVITKRSVTPVSTIPRNVTISTAK